MKNNKQKDLHFVVGTFDEKKQKGKPTTYCYKKSQVERRANLILSQKGHCWIKVIYQKGVFNEGVYKTLKDFKFALAAFIEQDNINYLTS